MIDKQFELAMEDINYKQRVIDYLVDYLEETSGIFASTLNAILCVKYGIQQEVVFNTLQDWLEDNPKYGLENGIYFKYNNNNNKSMKHKIELNGVTLEGPAEELVVIAKSMGHNLHYSKTRNTLERVQDMHINHLFNVIKEEIEDCSSPLKLLSYLEESPAVIHFLTKRNTMAVCTTATRVL